MVHSRQAVAPRRGANQMARSGVGSLASIKTAGASRSRGRRSLAAAVRWKVSFIT